MNYIHYDNRIVSHDDAGRTVAEVTFPDAGESLVDINHTFVDPSLRGQGVAEQLMLEAAKELRRQKKKAVLSCSYAAAWFGKHSDVYGDILEGKLL